MTVESLQPGFTPRLAGVASFEHNAQVLVDGLFETLHPRHPDFDPARTGRAITVADLRTTLGWIAKAMETGERRTVVDAKQLPVVRRIVHCLELGEVGDGPPTLSVDWRRRIDQQAAVHGMTGDLPVEDVRRWCGTCAPGRAHPALPIERHVVDDTALRALLEHDAGVRMVVHRPPGHPGAESVQFEASGCVHRASARIGARIAG